MTEQIGLDTIGQIAVYVKDLDRAVAFYRDVLGMQFLFQAPPGLAFFMCGDVRLLVERPEQGTEAANLGTSIIYYKVPDIDKAHQQISARGATFVDSPHKIADMPDHQLWMAFLKDSEGNMLALMEERRG